MNELINIIDSSGVIRYTTPLNEGCVWRKELMKHDQVLIKFNEAGVIEFRKGDYVEMPFGKYELVDHVFPTYNKSTGGYDYELTFEALHYKWKNKILFFHRENNANREASWSLTSTPEDHLSIILENLEALGYTCNGSAYQISLDASVDQTAKTISYDGINILDALTKIAETWEAEWWIEGNFIYVGKCEYNSSIDFVMNENVSNMSRSSGSNDFANRIYAFGSTRNLPSDYRSSGENIYVNGIVQKRLMLPTNSGGFVDANRDDASNEEIVEGVAIFDDIYPRRVGTMSTISTKEYTEEIENEDGTTTLKPWNAYRFTDEEITFSKDYMLPGEELRIVFTSGKLNGMDFGVAFNPDDKKGSDAQVFEIVRNEDYGIPLPNDTLKPNPLDNYILYGFDISLVGDSYVEKAEIELLERAQKHLEKSKEDPSVYDCTMNMTSEDGYPDLNVGDRVRLLNPVYFDADGRRSRIYGFEKHLDDSQVTYTVGNTTKYSRLANVENEIKEIVYDGNAYSGGGGGGVYVIGKYDSTIPSDRNVFSSLRSRHEFVSKQYNDTVHGKLTLEQKLQADGGINVGHYTPGFLGGGTNLDPEGYAEMSGLKLREYLEVPELRFNRIDVISGETWNTFAFGKVKSVDTESQTVIVDLVEGELLNVRVNDIFRGIFHNLTGENNIEEGADECGFERTVGFSTAYFTPTQLLDDGTGFKYALKPGSTVHPCPEMKFAAYGNFSDKSRQSSAYSTRTTEILLAGVNTWVINPDKHYMYIKGKLDGMTIGGLELKGYSTLQRNSYLMGTQIQFTPEQLDDMKGNDAYSVNLSTYEGVIVVDGNGHVIGSMQNERNVISGEQNVITGEQNVTATGYKLVTRIQAFHGPQELRYNTVMEEDSYMVTVYANGLEYEISGGVIMITKVTDIHNAYIDMEVNCEGMALFSKHYQVTAVLDGSSVWTTYHDSESEPERPEGDGSSGGWHRDFTSSVVWASYKSHRLITDGEWGDPVRIAGIEGDSAFALNLTSDTDAIACNADGTPMSTGVLASTQAVLYVGGVPITSGVTFSMYGSGCTITANSNNTGVVEVTGISADNAFVEITALYNNRSIAARYSLVKIKGTAIYQLLPSVEVIKRSLEGSLVTLTPKTLNCGITKADNSIFTQISTLPDGYSIKYGSTDTALKAYTLGSDLNTADFPDGIIFTLYNEEGTLIDKEVIPVVSDGSSAFYLDLTNENASVTCDKTGKVIGTIPTSQAYVYSGSSLDSGWTLKAVFTGCTGTISEAGLITVTDLTADNATVTVTATQSSETLTAVYTLSKVYPGADGAPATVYWLEPSVNVVQKNKNGVLTPASVSCLKMKQVGADPAAQTTEKTLKYQLSTGSETLYSGPVSIGSATWLDFILYDGTTVLDKERIPVVTDGSDGKDGNKGKDGGQYITMYKYSDVVPTAFPNVYIYKTDEANRKSELYQGWTFAIPSPPVMTYHMKEMGNNEWRVSNGTYMSPQLIDNFHERIKISFRTKSPNETVHLKAIISSGSGCYGYVLKPDTDVTPNAQNTLFYEYGTENKDISVVIPTPGEHYIIAGYNKQGVSANQNTFSFRMNYPSKLWSITAFAYESAGTMWEIQEPRWSAPILLSELSRGCKLSTSISQISLNSIGSLVPSSFVVYAKDDAGNKTSGYYLVLWKSTNGEDWVMDSYVINKSEILVTPSPTYIMYRIRAVDGTDINGDYVDELIVNLVKDGNNAAAGSFIRNCGQWSASRSYVWNSEFRDVVFILNSGTSSVWMVNVFDEKGTVTSRPGTGSEWIQANKEIFTAIDTALIDGADIAGFMFKNEKMISHKGTINGVEKDVKDLTSAELQNFIPNISMDGDTGAAEFRKVKIYASIAAPYERYSTLPELRVGQSMNWYLSLTTALQGASLPLTADYNGIQIGIYNASVLDVMFKARLENDHSLCEVTLPGKTLFKAEAIPWIVNNVIAGVTWSPLVQVKKTVTGNGAYIHYRVISNIIT